MARMTDLAEVKSGQQEAWASGDLAVFANTIVIVSELLCEAMDLRAGQKVLDVATGTGNTAIAAARRFCDVTGVDFAPPLLERARERAAVERLPVTFLDGDAEDIPFPDASYDIVLSTFGTMFAPNQEKVASELLRVCRPGGKIGTTNFPPDSFASEFFRVMARYAPPPRGVRPAILWGVEDRLRELFGDHISALQMTRRTLWFRYRSAEHWVEVFRGNFGPVKAAFEELEPAKQERLAADLVQLVESWNESGDDAIKSKCDYVEVVVTKKA